VPVALSVSLSGCGGSASRSGLAPAELFSLGKAEYERKKYFKAIELFQSVVFNHPGASVVDSAQYYLGLSYFGNKDYTLAGIEFNRLLLNYPASVFALNAQFMKAAGFFEGTPKDYSLDQSDLRHAIRQFDDFIIDHPESELVEDAKTYLGVARLRLARKYYESGVVYLRLNSPKSARIYFQTVIDEFTDTEYASKATYYIAEGEEKAGRYEEARRLYENFVTVFPTHEWADRARQSGCIAAFRAAEDAFDKNDYSLARDRFLQYRETCGGFSNVEKADEYLARIEELLLAVPQASSSES